MIQDLKPYPAYKDSGVPWLGGVPEHWGVRRSRNAVEMRVSNIDKHTKDGEQPVRLCNYVDVYKNDRITDRLSFMRATARPDEIKRFRMEPGDVLITKDSESWNDIGVPSLVEYAAPDLVCGYHLALLRPFRGLLEGAYLLRALQSPAIAYPFYVAANGVTRYGLSHDAIKSFLLPLPPLPEQAAIARFLDHADRRIRGYIRAKKKLIKLLGEQKQAIIHRAVTRGLPSTGSGQATPDVRLKPSGVGWLGEVPEHWDVAALRHRYSQCLGKMLDSKRITGSHALPYLRNTDVQWDRINVDDLPAMDIPPAEYGRYTVQRGDLLVCEGGEVGRCALWSGELAVCGFQKALHRLRPRNVGQDVPRFMYYVLRAAAKGNAFNDGHLSTIAHLTGDKLRAHRFPFPPMAEQHLLVSFLDAALKQIDQAAFTALREIALLREYRTRLIADVVTGKLDVREAAARLPEEEEPLVDGVDGVDEDTMDGEEGDDESDSDSA
ncbi:MAG: restriction endonuclease subunit S [candidate division NC10 bacterium]|nr:restriction endonuclease subunit S [candidate division NC10 bacterium]